MRLERKEAPVDAWASEFDAWVGSLLEERAVEELSAYRSRGPSADRAVPGSEHLDPLFVVLGAVDERDRARTLYEGFQYGNLSMRSIAYAAGGS